MDEYSKSNWGRLLKIIYFTVGVLYKYKQLGMESDVSTLLCESSHIKFSTSLTRYHLKSSFLKLKVCIIHTFMYHWNANQCFCRLRSVMIVGTCSSMGRCNICLVSMCPTESTPYLKCRSCDTRRYRHIFLCNERYIWLFGRRDAYILGYIYFSRLPSDNDFFKRMIMCLGYLSFWHMLILCVITYHTFYELSVELRCSSITFNAFIKHGKSFWHHHEKKSVNILRD